MAYLEQLQNANTGSYDGEIKSKFGHQTKRKIESTKILIKGI